MDILTTALKHGAIIETECPRTDDTDFHHAKTPSLKIEQPRLLNTRFISKNNFTAPKFPRKNHSQKRADLVKITT